MTEVLEGQISIFDLVGSSGKMFPEPDPVTAGEISKRSSQPSAKSKTPKFQFLSLKKGGDRPQPSWETATVSPIEHTTVNTGESPKDAVDSFLWEILDLNAPPKYCLSQRACQGILRRADTRGKTLPPMLRAALEETVRNENSPRSDNKPTAVYAVENHAMDCRVTLSKDGTVQTLSNRMGTGGGNVPFVLMALGGTDAKAAVTDGSISPTVLARAGTGGGNEPIVVLEGVLRGTAVENSSGGGVTGTLDSNYYRGVGARGGVEREFVALAKCIGNGQANQSFFSDNVGALNCMHDQQAVMYGDANQYTVRRLTPRECCRLQGFPDWWDADVAGPDSARYKMWGNGLTLEVAYDVLSRIVKAAEAE